MKHLGLLLIAPMLLHLQTPMLLHAQTSVEGGTFSAQDPAAKQAYEQTVLPYLRQHCFECHDAKKAKAGLRLDELGTDFLAGKTADTWHEVINSINIGEMPPEEVKRRPDPSQSFAVVEWVGRELKNADKMTRMAGGKILSRRLNRSEYLNTVRDLLQLDEKWVQALKEELPSDGKAEGFDRLGSALFFDETQLSAYVHVAGMLTQRAIVDDEHAPPVVKPTTVEFGKNLRPRRKAEISEYIKGTAIDPGPSTIEKTDVGLLYLQSLGYGNLSNSLINRENGVTKDGYYRIRVKAGAYAGVLERPVRLLFTYMRRTPLETSAELEITAPIDSPEEVEVIMFLRKPPEGAGEMMIKWTGLNDIVIRNPEVVKLTNRLRVAAPKPAKLVAAKAPSAEVDAAKAEIEEIKAASIAYAQQPDAVATIYNPEHDRTKTPRLHLVSMTFEGPIEKEWPPKSHVAFFPGGMKEDPAQVREMFARLLPHAYRRYVTEGEIEQFVALTAQAKQKFNLSHVDAVRYSVQTLLTSPEFLLLFEPSAPNAPLRALSDFELATRLSYFLWSTMPDSELLRVAAAGKLREPAVRQAQVKRMLAHPMARQFAENFAGQWLGVREYDSVIPALDYKDYDAALREANQEEPIAFFEEVLRNDLSVLNFIDSDFTMANERLAKFYGIPNVAGEEFRRAALQPEQHRGGVLTMAGLLTYLSDGTRTQPVRRGAWILEEIFNNPPAPPPPNAGEIQPNASGKNLTVRERLEMHRNEPTCASCHAKIDPLGLALENYDAIGAWRTKQNGEGFRSGNAPAIDATGKLPSGREFKNPGEFKQALLAEKDRFARALTQKVLTYALGRPVGYTDTDTVEQITAQLAANQYRMHSLIQAVVGSEPFLTK